MSFRRRLEVITGGPARDFSLTVREADLLADACELLAESHRNGQSGAPAADASEAQSDSEVLAHIHDLRQRLLEHCGYTRRPRA